jgi:hypothetical protein
MGPMRQFSLALVMMLVIGGAGRAQTMITTAAAQGTVCRSAITVAESGSGIPARLLAAISRVETGRRDPLTGAVDPWPWTANAEGEGYFFDTKAQAVAAVRAMRARGIRSIDVGCGQINLMYHPDAFATLEQAFDPRANTAYAARFLRQLFELTGDWKRATAMYHSATPALGAEYRQKVLAVWPEEQKLPRRSGMTPLAQAWAATLSSSPAGFSHRLWRTGG